MCICTVGSVVILVSVVLMFHCSYQHDKHLLMADEVCYW